MKTHKHTSGDWSIPHFALKDSERVIFKDRDGHDVIGSCKCKYVLSENYMGAIATVHCAEGENIGDDPTLEEAIANARLISAAPKLLAALEVMLESATPNAFDHPAMFSAWGKAREIISEL